MLLLTFRRNILPHSSTFKMEETPSSEALVTIYRNARRHIPQNSILFIGLWMCDFIYFLSASHPMKLGSNPTLDLSYYRRPIIIKTFSMFSVSRQTSQALML